ncbi:MAG: hypothetical protein AAF799_46960 [Myxococcota bacterium]
MGLFLALSIVSATFGCSMKTASKTGTHASGLANDVAAVGGALELCELEGLAKGLSVEDVCQGLRSRADDHEKGIKLLAAYGKQLDKLATASGPEGKALAKAVLEVVEPDGLDDYTDLIATGTDEFVKLVARGWTRAEVRSNVKNYERTIMSVALAELVFAREALADARKADEEVCKTMEASAKDLDELRANGSLAEQRFGWPMGANLVRMQVHERRQFVARLETRLYGLLLATAYLGKWARKEAEFKDDKKLAGTVGKALECAAWDKRLLDECKPHREVLSERLTANSLPKPERDPAVGMSRVVTTLPPCSAVTEETK